MTNHASTYQEAATSGLLVELERRDESDGPGPRHWDASACCAAFQFGACSHTESFDESELDDLEAQWRRDFPEEAEQADVERAIWEAERAAAAAAPQVEEPF